MSWNSSCKPLCGVGEEVEARGQGTLDEVGAGFDMHRPGSTSLCQSWDAPWVSTTVVISGYRALGPIPASGSSSNKMMIIHTFSLQQTHPYHVTVAAGTVPVVTSSPAAP